MKEYDREKRQWVEKEDIVKKIKKRKLCKGGKEHEYILTLPPYIKAKTSILGIDIAPDFYRIEKETEEILQEKYKEMEAIGIQRSTGSIYTRSGKYYTCKTCLKNTYKFNKDE